MNQPASDINTSQAVARDTPLRFVTAASLFDGHDAAINIMRRLIQAQGCEVIHLGHNRGVLDIVRAAIQEDADAIAVSSYQGGHNEFFRFMIDQLEERGAGHIQVFAGGGGTITLEEIADLQAYGVNRIYHPDDGMHLGLVEMIEDVVQRAATHRKAPMPPTQLRRDNAVDVAQMLTALETGLFGDAELEFKRREWAGRPVQAPVIGITGTGGSGKSSVTDELLNRLLSARLIIGSIFQFCQALIGKLDYVTWDTGQGGDMQTITAIGRAVLDRMHEDNGFFMFDRIEMNITDVGMRRLEICQFEVMGSK